jgi:hypothetical protein
MTSGFDDGCCSGGTIRQQLILTLAILVTMNAFGIATESADVGNEQQRTPWLTRLVDDVDNQRYTGNVKHAPDHYERRQMAQLFR